MKKLSIMNQNGILIANSREVAEKIGKRHSDLLESIKTYIKHLTNGKFRSLDFFIPDVYMDTKGEERPCYLLTRKGCDMVANKTTGEKGIIFTAEYVTQFEYMETKIKAPIQELSPQLQLLINMELEQKKLKEEIVETKEEVQAIREVVEIKPSDTWRKDTNIILSKICKKLNDYRNPKEEVYKALQERAGCDLKIRLKNMRGRLALEGATKTKIDNLNYLDVIESDKKLIEIYVSIVKDMVIKYKFN